jgi:hypothetical protein
MPETKRYRTHERRLNGEQKLVSAWIDAALWRRLKLAVVERESTINDLVSAAITMHLKPKSRRPAS